MNANELSDELKDIFITLSIGQQCEPILLESATMLRQQQAEIEALKKHNGELQKACVETLFCVMGKGGYCSLDIEVILKNVLGSEWEDYK